MASVTESSIEPVRSARRGEGAADYEDFAENAMIGLHRLSSDGRILWANRAEYGALGYEADEYVGRDARDFHEDPSVIEGLLKRLAAGEKVIGLETVMLARDGSKRHVVLTSTARYDEQGGLVDTRGISQDVSGQKLEELRSNAERDERLRYERSVRERLALLGRASDTLSLSLDYERTLDAIVGVALPRLGDFAFLDVHEGDGVRRLTRAHDDQATDALLKDCRPPALEVEDHDLNALTSRQPALHRVFDTSFLPALTALPEHVALLDSLGIRSMITVPLEHHGETLGALTLFYASSKREHGDEELSLAEEIADRAASALVNARLFKEARDAIGVRDDFLSMAGHELRTPLTALQLQILSITKMINQPDATEKVAARADKAGRNVLRLSSLVNELLDISRISAGRLKLERGAMDMGEAVREVLHRHADELQKNGCEVHFTAAGDVTGNWDRVRIEQIATNLLANAIKYGKGKPIDVRVQRDGDAARLVVQDHGIGISAEDQLRIFQRFERAVSARHFGGLGLGLWIARQLVDAHGGSIQVKSETGHGAMFEVALPLAPPATLPPEAHA